MGVLSSLKIPTDCLRMNQYTSFVPTNTQEKSLFVSWVNGRLSHFWFTYIIKISQLIKCNIELGASRGYPMVYRVVIIFTSCSRNFFMGQCFINHFFLGTSNTYYGCNSTQNTCISTISIVSTIRMLSKTHNICVESSD